MNQKKINVIDIVDKYTITINYGSDDGATNGDNIRIYEEGSEVFDLDKKSLGKIDIVKDDLEIDIVYSKFSLCKKKITTVTNLFSTVNFKREEVTIKALNVQEKDMSGLKYKTSLPIKVGDLVKILKK